MKCNYNALYKKEGGEDALNNYTNQCIKKKFSPSIQLKLSNVVSSIKSADI